MSSFSAYTFVILQQKPGISATANFPYSVRRKKETNHLAHALSGESALLLLFSSLFLSLCMHRALVACKCALPSSLSFPFSSSLFPLLPLVALPFPPFPSLYYKRGLPYMQRREGEGGGSGGSICMHAKRSKGRGRITATQVQK